MFLVKVFWNYAANLQENTHAKVQLQQSSTATLLAYVFSCKFAAYFQNIFS